MNGERIKKRIKSDHKKKMTDCGYIYWYGFQAHFFIIMQRYYDLFDLPEWVIVLTSNVKKRLMLTFAEK